MNTPDDWLHVLLECNSPDFSCHEREFASIEAAFVESGPSRVDLGVQRQFAAETIIPVSGKVIGGVLLGISVAEALCAKYAAAVAAV